MNITDREKLLYQICSPYLLGNIAGNKLKFFEPTVPQRNTAYQIYDEWFACGIRNGFMTEEEHLDFLIENGLWDSVSEEQKEGIISDIDKLKIGLCEMFFRSKERMSIKNNILSAEAVLAKLIKKRHSYDFLLADNLAKLAKNTFLLLCEIYDVNNKLFVDPDRIFDTPLLFFDEISSFRITSQMEEETIRILARTEPWRTHWMLSNNVSDLFGTNTLRLHINQQQLIVWSKIYDNVRESHECPPDELLSDDNALDGWFLIQKKKIDKERNQTQIEKFSGSDKIKNSQEIYLMADTPEDARKIYEMNDLSAKMLIKQREQAIRQAGTIKEQHLPDSQLKLRMMAAEKYAEGIKQNR